MAKWKILHLVGEDISIWSVEQIANHLNFLPDELFEQTLVVDRPQAARFIEYHLLRRVYCTGKRTGSELIAARNLSKFIKKENIDVIVCWDMQAVDQLRLALPGTRKSFNILLMLIKPINEKDSFAKLKLNHKNLNMYIICSSEAIVRWVKQILRSDERIFKIYPAIPSYFNIDRNVLRRRFNFDDDEILIYVSEEAKPHDILLTIHSIGMVQQLHPKTRAIVAVRNSEFVDRLVKFARETLPENIISLIDYNDANLILPCCDAVIIPRGRSSEPIVALEAMGCKIPVIISEYDEFDDVMIPDETFLAVKKFIPRTVASALYRLISDDKLQTKLTSSANEIIKSKCSKLTYRGEMVKMYQQISKQSVQLNAK